jgi:hypothetical protein
MKKLNIVVIFLGFLFVLLFISITFKEGMEGGMSNSLKNDCQYKFLGPVPKTPEGTIKPWNEDIILEFINVYNNINTKADTGFKMDKDIIKNWETFMAEDEARYYIKNAKFPYNPYINDMIKNDKLDPKLTGKINKDNVSVIGPVRLLYISHILPSEKDLEQKPDSFKIYNGDTPEPNCKSFEIEEMTKIAKNDLEQLKRVCTYVNKN